MSTKQKRVPIEVVDAIRKARAEDKSFDAISQEFGVPRSTVYDVCNRQAAEEAAQKIAGKAAEGGRRGQIEALLDLSLGELRRKLRTGAFKSGSEAASAIDKLATAATKLSAEEKVNEDGLPGPSVVIEITGGGACLIIVTGTRLEALRHALDLCEKFRIDAAVPAIQAALEEEQNRPTPTEAAN